MRNSPGSVIIWVREELIMGRIHLAAPVASQVTADSDLPRLALMDGFWQRLTKGQPTPLNQVGQICLDYLLWPRTDSEG